ncbi:TPA: hypothetical protein DEP21_02850 [Patescibacteria group bacterium]|nr:hypothetical protein [Candidatus Gracilibacteria bacterium]
MASCNTTLNNVFWSAGSYSGYAQKLVSCPSNLVTKTTSKSTYLPGETAGFSINVTNTLSTTISNISLKDIWPSCASFTGTFTSTLAGVQGSQNGNISTWTIPGSLAAGQSFTISFYGSVSTNSACIGQFQTNTATLSYYDGSSTKENTTTVNFSIAQVSDVVDIKKIIISPKS